MNRLNSFIIRGLIKIGIRVGLYSRHMLPYCIKNSMDCEARMLVEKGVGMDMIDRMGDTPLHRAIYENRETLVGGIISSGFNVDIVNIDGKAPMHVAVSCGNIKIVKMLIKAKANVNVRDKFFRTPIHYAVNKSHEEILKLLLDNGANVDARDLNGETPLYRAIKYGRSKVENILLDYSKNINIANKYGCNLLHIAINKNDCDIIPILLSRGINVNKKNVVGESPLVLAVSRGNIDVAKILIDNGADMEVMENLEKVELIDISLRKESKDMIMFLLRNGANVTASLKQWAKDKGDMDILREIEKRVCISNNDTDGLKAIIQYEKSNGIKYNNNKLYKMAIVDGRREIANILMYNLNDDKLEKLRDLMWDKDINDALNRVDLGEVAKKIRRERDWYAKTLIVDLVHEFKKRENMRKC